ncbi:uncharacterized protein LOC128290552 [Gossypium arboreum]|uniref:uncharacterized protein LOC128290552 n=1 Tax=Gossypium arboreum TaxID=29729 RepID=UPI0022F1DC1C|nr:uncharacterized protein LOC128290552 [Gossypium arboreum]
MFACLSLFDDGSLLAELQVKPTWIEQVKGKQLEGESLGLHFQQLELPPELDQIRDVFHVSMLRCYRSDLTHIVPVEEIEVRPDLTFEEEPIQILDRDVKILRRKSISLVKVLWSNHSSEEAMWEPEDAMHQHYLYLF